jgi:hypothetical protein
MRHALLGLPVDDQLSRQLGNIHLFIVGALFNEDSLRAGAGGTQGRNSFADLSTCYYM